MWHWAAGGPTNLDNLILVCSFHHRRIHEGGYRLLVDADGGRHFHHPSGYELEPGGAVGPADPGRTLDVVPPYSSGWDGTRLDLPLTVDCLMQHLDSAESPEPAARSAP